MAIGGCCSLSAAIETSKYDTHSLIYKQHRNTDYLGSTEGPTYAIKAWPQGYKMFEHKTGAQNKPRRIIYLYGTVVLLSLVM